MHVFFVLLTVAVIPSMCRGLHCNVFPKDQYIEVGSSAKLVCQTACVNGKIFWTLNSRPLNKNLSETINSTHTVLLLRNFTHHSATLECHSEQKKQVLGGTTIRTFSKPGKISCMLYYKDPEDTGLKQQFTCTWEHQTNSSMKINYSVLLSQTEICGSHVTTCTCSSLSTIQNILENDIFNITIRATTAAWEANSDPYEFNRVYISKIKAPTVNVRPSPNHLFVAWKPRPFLSSEKYKCQVKYYKTLSNGETPEHQAPHLKSCLQIQMLNKSHIAEPEWNVTIEEVESCTTYTVSVRCAYENALWSDWSKETTVLTKLNKKHVRTGVWRKVGEPGKNRKRKVHVMWVDIPPTCEETVCYSVRQLPYHNDTTKESDIYTACNSTACDVDVDQHAQRLNLIVSLDDAVIAEDSVYIPAVEESLFQVSDIQALSQEGNIVVSWKAPDIPVSGYMIDWTHNGHQYYWQESKFTNATLFDLLDKKPYNITVTPLLSNRTGHSTEAPQICSSYGDPGNVTITPDTIGDKTAHVRWNLHQDACSAAVIYYRVFYQADKGPLNVTVDSKMDSVSLKDLNPNTQYRVYVEAISHVRNTTSNYWVFITKRFDQRLIAGLSIFGGIIIFLVLFLGLYCANQWKKFKEKLVPNPGLSSVGKWLQQIHERREYIFQPFCNPPKDHCDQVYTEETLRASTPSLSSDCNDNTARDRYTEISFSDPVIPPVPEEKSDKLPEPAETPHSSSPGESTTFILEESGLVSPYRSQSSVKTAVPKTGKQNKRALGKRQGKSTTMTVYVSLGMLDQGDAR